MGDDGIHLARWGRTWDPQGGPGQAYIDGRQAGARIARRGRTWDPLEGPSK